MPTSIDADPTTIDADGGSVTVDTYCPTCGGDAVPIVGRDCDCDLAEDVICSAVIEYPDEEPLRTTITAEDVTVEKLLSAAVRALDRRV